MGTCRARQVGARCLWVILGCLLFSCPAAPDSNRGSGTDATRLTLEIAPQAAVVRLVDPAGRSTLMRGKKKSGSIPRLGMVLMDEFSIDEDGVPARKRIDIWPPTPGEWQLTVALPKRLKSPDVVWINVVVAGPDWAWGGGTTSVTRMASGDSSRWRLTWGLPSHAVGVHRPVSLVEFPEDASAKLVVEVFNGDSLVPRMALNEPVEFANVDFDEPRELHVTDKDGRVTIAGVKPGRYVVRVRALGWKVQEPDTVTLKPGEVAKLRHALVGGYHVVQY